MGRLNERLQVARKALSTLNELAQISQPNSIERDAAIQRFEYTLEASWKCAQRYLLDVEKISAPSPKAVIRFSRDIGLFDDKQTVIALIMCDDRNLTSHTYNESLAQQLFSRLPSYTTLMGAWLESIERRLNEQ